MRVVCCVVCLGRGVCVCDPVLSTTDASPTGAGAFRHGGGQVIPLSRENYKKGKNFRNPIDITTKKWYNVNMVSKYNTLEEQKNGRNQEERKADHP